MFIREFRNALREAVPHAFTAQRQGDSVPDIAQRRSRVSHGSQAAELGTSRLRLFCPQLRTCKSRTETSGLGHAWTAPCCQEFSACLQPWSEQPCVRPFTAVHMTAGHNALRGSGPSQQVAFRDAMAQLGCPDHRIDRSALHAVRPFQHSRLAARSRA